MCACVCLWLGFERDCDWIGIEVGSWELWNRDLSFTFFFEFRGACFLFRFSFFLRFFVNCGLLMLMLLELTCILRVILRLLFLQFPSFSLYLLRFISFSLSSIFSVFGLSIVYLLYRLSPFLISSFRSLLEL